MLQGFRPVQRCRDDLVGSVSSFLCASAPVAFIWSWNTSLPPFLHSACATVAHLLSWQLFAAPGVPKSDQPSDVSYMDKTLHDSVSTVSGNYLAARVSRWFGFVSLENHESSESQTRSDLSRSCNTNHELALCSSARWDSCTGCSFISPPWVKSSFSMCLTVHARRQLHVKLLL